MVSFDLTPDQEAVRTHIRSFCRSHLATARSIYDPPSGPLPGASARFRATKPLYDAAVTAGLVKAQIPQALGGLGGDLIDSAIVVEEMYAVETTMSLTILGTGLGLTPLIMGGTPEMQAKYLKPFLTGEGAPLASLVFSEPTGSANFAEGVGFGTVAKVEGSEYVINGEKIWATNCSGWDDRGADLQCVVLRVEGGSTARSQTAIIIVTREDIARNDPEAYQVLNHPETVGHTAVNGPHIRFKDLRVPLENLLAPPGKGAELVEMTFTASAALVGAMGVGIGRQAFDIALAWAKDEKRGGDEILLQKQSVADILIKIKTRTEATRALTWKAAKVFGSREYGAEICYEAKIFGSESAVESVYDAINLVGTSAYNRTSRLGHLLQDAVVLPIFDGGNVGVRRRQIERIFKDPDYSPWETTYGREKD